MNLIRAIRASLAHAKAGKSLDARDYANAYESFCHTKELLGKDLDKPGLFEIHLRGAFIQFQLGLIWQAEQSLACASRGISNFRKLTHTDRAYLLDYCDAYLLNAKNSDLPFTPRLGKEKYYQVSARYRNRYPLIQ